MPLVSIVTPTFPGRERVLLERCMPSVYGLSWPNVEFVVVSDENPGLEDALRLNQKAYDRTPGGAWRRLRFIEINDNWKNHHTRTANGAVPWMIGSRIALGEFIGFLGDDDELLPHHATAHVEAMKLHDAMWSVSKVEFRAADRFWNVIGDPTLAEGHLDATGIMCWKGALTVATWDPTAGIAAVDWKLVNDWRTNGCPGTFVNQVTGIHHDGWLSNMTGKPYDTPVLQGEES